MIIIFLSVIVHVIWVSWSSFPEYKIQICLSLLSFFCYSCESLLQATLHVRGCIGGDCSTYVHKLS